MKKYTMNDIIKEWEKTKKDCNYIEVSNHIKFKGNDIINYAGPVYGPRYISGNPYLKETLFYKVKLG